MCAVRGDSRFQAIIAGKAEENHVVHCMWASLSENSARKALFFCRSNKDLCCYDRQRIIFFLVHNDASDIVIDDDDDNGGIAVHKRQEDGPSGKTAFHANATSKNVQDCSLDGKYISRGKERTSGNFTDSLGMGHTLELPDSEDHGLSNCLAHTCNGDEALLFQLQDRAEHVQCSSFPNVCKKGIGSVNVPNCMDSAASDYKHQLDMDVNGLLQSQMPQSTDTYFAILQSCHRAKELVQARRVHSHIILSGAILTSFLGDYLVMTLAKCGAVDDAQRLYLTLPHRTVISCTALMSAYVTCGQPQQALKLYSHMQENQLEPDSYTFVSLLKAYEILQKLNLGRSTHIEVCKKGLTAVPHICNSLIDIYGKCGALVEAENIFCSYCKLNIVSWTVMLSVYLEQGQPRKALWLYRQMCHEGLKPDQFAYVNALRICSSIVIQKHDFIVVDNTWPLMAVRVVQGLHADALRTGYMCDVLVGTALLTAYGKCGTLAELEYMFGMIAERNLVTWNAMMSMYVDKGLEEKALLLYTWMHRAGKEPEQMTFVIAFQACANLAEKDETILPATISSKAMSLQILQALHADFCNTEQLNSFVAATALLRSYAKCGAISEVEDIFNNILCPDLVLWNAMLSSYIDMGLGDKVIFLYARMQEECIAVDDVTLINVLLGCSETGNVELCKQVHFGAVSTNFNEYLPVAASLIHGYGSCSRIEDSQTCFDGISEPDAASWNACFANRSVDGSLIKALCMFESRKLAGMSADEVGFTSILTACMHAGLVTVGLESFESLIMDFGITPDVQHYSVLIDLFARAGDFKRTANILEGVPGHSNMNTWLFLLGACQTHGNIELAQQVFESALGLQPKQAVTYVLMSNIYAIVESHIEG